MISKRTKEALAAAKRRGVKLGNPNSEAHLRDYDHERGVEAIKANADSRAEGLRATVDGIPESGVTTFAEIAKDFYAQMIKTPRGGK